MSGPPECFLLPRIQHSEKKDRDEHQHLYQCDDTLTEEDNRPWIHEHHLHIESQEQQRHRVVTNVVARPRVHEGSVSTCIGNSLRGRGGDRIEPIAQPAHDQPAGDAGNKNRQRCSKCSHQSLEVVLGILLEGFGAVLAAEVIGLAVVFHGRRSVGLLNHHSAHRVFCCHRSTSPSLTSRTFDLIYDLTRRSIAAVVSATRSGCSPDRASTMQFRMWSSSKATATFFIALLAAVI